MAGPSQALMRSGGHCICCTVASSTPFSSPRQPACAAATHAAFIVAEQHRQTIGGHDSADLAGQKRHRGIRRARTAANGAGRDHVTAMHLRQPGRFGGQLQLLAQSGAIGRDAGGLIADVIAQIQAGKLPGTGAAPARAGQRPHMAGHLPVRLDKLNRHHLPPASRSGPPYPAPSALPRTPAHRAQDARARAESRAGLAAESNATPPAPSRTGRCGDRRCPWRPP